MIYIVKFQFLGIVLRGNRNLGVDVFGFHGKVKT